MDLLASALIAVSMVPIALYSAGPPRIALGLVFVLFLPGYALIAALFPRKAALEGVERLALSIGLSLAVVPLIGLLLNFTPWGIRLIPILSTLAGFVVAMAVTAYFRRRTLAPADRYALTVPPLLPSFRLGWGQRRPLDRALIVLLALAILGAMGTVAHMVAKPKVGEQFTEFYVLGRGQKAEDYPRKVVLGQEAAVTLGIINDELAPMTYRATVSVDGEMLKEIGPVSLDHEQRWEQAVAFRPTKAGESQRVEFLLYKGQASDPYRSLHLWVDVFDAAPRLGPTGVVERAQTPIGTPATDAGALAPLPSPTPPPRAPTGTVAPEPTSTPRPTATVTQSPSFVVVRDTGGLRANLREAPGLSAAVKRSWPEGTVLELLGDPVVQRDGYTWLRVQDPLGNVGWIIAGAVGPWTVEPTSTPRPTAPATPSPSFVVVRDTGGLYANLREAPGLSAAVKRSWPEGTVLELLGGPVVQRDGYTWLKVRDPLRNVGWIIAGAVGPWTASPAADPVIRRSELLGSYTVAPDETLSVISRRHRTTPELLVALNGLTGQGAVSAGQRLIVPKRPMVLHVVGQGETTGGIAARYGTTAEQLVELNGLGAGPLDAGQRLAVPLPAVGPGH